LDEPPECETDEVLFLERQRCGSVLYTID